jgi:hypothetical protein
VLLGASGIGELLANTLSVRNVIVIVLDVKVPTFDNGCLALHCPFVPSNRVVFSDNITFYKCDVSRWDEVDKVSKLD